MYGPICEHRKDLNISDLYEGQGRDTTDPYESFFFFFLMGRGEVSGNILPEEKDDHLAQLQGGMPESAA